MGSASRAVAAAAVTNPGVTKTQRQIVAMICAQTTAINGFGAKFTFFAGTGDVKATIILKPFFSVAAKKEEPMVVETDQAPDAAKKAAGNDVNFTFKEKKVTPAQPEAKAAAPSKAQAQAAPAASKAKAAPVQLKPKAPAMPKVDKNVLSARTDGAGARAETWREKRVRENRLEYPSSLSERTSSGSEEEPFVAMETSFPPLSLPAKKEPRGLLPGQRPAASVGSSDGRGRVPHIS